jgi:MFS family permease
MKLGILGLPKGVLLLGFASLFNDVASEAIYPLLPLFLTQVVGGSVLFIGLLEGMAESVASITKFLAGYFSDRFRSRDRFVLSGYGIAALARPLIGLVVAPWQAFAIRFTDRVGKGVRTAPRDAWLAGFAGPEKRGWVFGFHRSMDHAGAMLGPLLATAFLFFFPGSYRQLFLLTVIPGLLVLLFVFLATREARRQSLAEAEAKPAERVLGGGRVRKMPGSFKWFLLIVGIFTLGNSSDAFLLLKLKDAGVGMGWIPAAWAAFSLVKMLTSSLGGIFSDRVGRRPAIVTGWAIYGLVYLGFALASSLHAVLGLFLFYGVFYGLTEGPEKALVADLVPAERRGTAFGLYNLVIGLGAFPASVLFGAVAQKAGFGAAFALGAGLAALAAVAFLIALPRLGRAQPA